MNNVSLIGNLTRDVEIRKSDNGTTIASFSLAVRRDNDHTDFINCKAFNGTADILEKYTHKGNKIGLVGRIQTGSYQNQEGKTVYTTDVMANMVFLLGGNTTNNESTEEPKNNSNEYDITLSDDDLPF